jgi:hypothetical protein
MANFVASSTAVFRLHLVFDEFFSCFQCIFNLESTTMLSQFIQALQLDPLLHARPMLQYWTLANYTWLIDFSESEAHIIKLFFCNANFRALYHLLAASYTRCFIYGAASFTRWSA